MTRTLFVHIGPRKTATSAIQRILAYHDGSVVLYPDIRFGAARDEEGLEQRQLAVLYSHHPLVFGMFRERERAWPGRLARKLAAIREQAAGSNRNVLFSSEELRPRNVAAFVETVLPYLGEGPFDVEVLLACREHFARAASLYGHRLRGRRSRETRTPDEFLREAWNELCYATTISTLQAANLRMTLLDYHPPATFVGRFLQHIGFAPGTIPPQTLENVGQDPRTLLVALAVRQVVESPEIRHELLRKFSSLTPVKTSSEFIFSREAVQEVEQHFARDRQFLLQTCGVALSPPDVARWESNWGIPAEQFCEIEAIAASAGTLGRAISEFVSRHVY